MSSLRKEVQSDVLDLLPEYKQYLVCVFKIQFVLLTVGLSFFFFACTLRDLSVLSWTEDDLPVTKTRVDILDILSVKPAFVSHG